MSGTEQVEEARPRLYVRASLCAPPYASLFLQTGGAITGAAAALQVDLALSGTTESVGVDLAGMPKAVELPLPKDAVVMQGEAALDAHVAEASQQYGARLVALVAPEDAAAVRANQPFVVFNVGSRLNGLETRLAPAIDGTVAITEAGLGTMPLRQLVHDGTATMPMVYGAWGAHASVVSFSRARVLAEDGTRMPAVVLENADVVAGRPNTVDAAYKTALQTYIDAAWDLRNPERPNAIVYEPAPSLTKSAFSTPLGQGATGYSFLPAFVQESHLPLQALEDICCGAVACSLGVSAYDQQHRGLLAECARPGDDATKNIKVLASAMSIVASYLMPYRADGRNSQTPDKQVFVASELWSQQAPRATGLTANDCDGSASLVVGICNRIANDATLTAWIKEADGRATEPTANSIGTLVNEPNTFVHLRAFRNAFAGHAAAVTVLAANAAEATAAGASHTTVQGHAIAALFPIQNTIDALYRGEQKRYVPGNAPPAVVHAARLAACGVSADQGAHLKPVPIEGTTPTTAIFSQLATEEELAELSKVHQAIQTMGPTVFRAVQDLHIGGGPDKQMPTFYKDIVEATFSVDSPLYADESLRSLGAAAGQILFVSDGKAGVTPQQLQTNSFDAVPLVSLDASLAKTLDAATKSAKLGIVPPSGAVPVATPQCEQVFNDNMARLRGLGESLARASAQPIESETAVVTMIGTLAALAHNPNAVKHFCDRALEVSQNGCVDIYPVRQLLQTADGRDLAQFVVVSAGVRVQA